MASETVKIIGGNGFNEGGGTVFSTVTGVATDLTNSALTRIALPADENRYGITEYVTIVVSYMFFADAATTVTFKSATTAISGAMTLNVNGSAAMEEAIQGLMWTEPGEALNMTNSAGNINGHLTYVIV